jgi:hypothetical protein
MGTVGLIPEGHHRKIAVKTAPMAERDMEIEAAGQAPMGWKRHTHGNLPMGPLAFCWIPRA